MSHAVKLEANKLVFKTRGERDAYGKNLHMTQEYANDPHSTIINFSNLFLDQVRLPADRLLVATYRRPSKTAGGIFLTDKNLDEDKFQGAAGLVLKIGSKAFQSDANTDFGGFHVNVHEWVTYRPVYGVAREFAGVHFRILQDIHIDGVVEDPTLVW